eukprot:GHVT01028679.1.p1 GENE.GHVT01028679.1~~GHVT01028679.1.p1  ORF type:complete len:350 (-),score=29.33 GHVT01028679.1:434-1483(-)
MWSSSSSFTTLPCPLGFSRLPNKLATLAPLLHALKKRTRNISNSTANACALVPIGRYLKSFATVAEDADQANYLTFELKARSRRAHQFRNRTNEVSVVGYAELNNATRRLPLPPRKAQHHGAGATYVIGDATPLNEDARAAHDPIPNCSLGAGAGPADRDAASAATSDPGGVWHAAVTARNGAGGPSPPEPTKVLQYAVTAPGAQCHVSLGPVKMEDGTVYSGFPRANSFLNLPLYLHHPADRALLPAGLASFRPRGSYFGCPLESTQHATAGRIAGLQTHTQRRFYNPRAHVEWVRIKRRERVSYLMKKKRKPKNNAAVLQRFRLTRFGWERLVCGRNSNKKEDAVRK